MTCPTCEAPPTDPLPKQGRHHVAVRFGDTGGMGHAVLYRGNVVTPTVVEAMAGPPGAGWVEMWVCDSDGSPILHPPAPRQCSACDAELGMSQADEDGCEDCGHVGPSYRAWLTHVATTIRHGHVAILRGTELISGPPSAGADVGPALAGSPDEQVRAQIALLASANPGHAAFDKPTGVQAIVNGVPVPSGAPLVLDADEAEFNDEIGRG